MSFGAVFGGWRRQWKDKKKPPSLYDSLAVSEPGVACGREKNTPTSRRDLLVVLEAGVVLVSYPSL